MYFTRKLEDSFLKYNKEYKVLLLTGQRQSGKTTMLEHLIKPANKSQVFLVPVPFFHLILILSLSTLS